MKLSKHKRWDASRKAEVAMVLLKGASLEEVSRLTGQLAYVLKEWEKSFLQGDQATFHVGESAKETTLEAENRALKAKVGALVMDNDLLYAKIDRLKDGVPLPLRQSKC